MNWQGPHVLTDFGEEGAASRPIRTADADFDQLMRGEIHVDFAQDRSRRSGIADRHHGFEGMSAGLEGATLGGLEFVHRLFD